MIKSQCCREFPPDRNRQVVTPDGTEIRCSKPLSTIKSDAHTSLLVSDAPSDTKRVTGEGISREPLAGQAYSRDQQRMKPL